MGKGRGHGSFRRRSTSGDNPGPKVRLGWEEQGEVESGLPDIIRKSLRAMRSGVP